MALRMRVVIEDEFGDAANDADVPEAIAGLRDIVDDTLDAVMRSVDDEGKLYNLANNFGPGACFAFAVRSIEHGYADFRDNSDPIALESALGIAAGAVFMGLAQQRLEDSLSAERYGGTTVEGEPAKPEEPLPDSAHVATFGEALRMAKANPGKVFFTNGGSQAVRVVQLNP